MKVIMEMSLNGNTVALVQTESGTLEVSCKKKGDPFVAIEEFKREDLLPALNKFHMAKDRLCSDSL
jgi:hypothetical protein